MEPLKLTVTFHEGAWKMRVGDRLSRPFLSEREAISAAIHHAHDLGKQGYETQVVMKAMTCYYGPDGLVRALPTPRG